MPISNFAKSHGLADKDGNLYPSIEICYGPYSSLEEAFNKVKQELAIESDEDLVYIPIGLTVGIKDANGNIEEYWFNGGHDKAHLVKKNAGGGGGGMTPDEKQAFDDLKDRVDGDVLEDVGLTTSEGGMYLQPYRGGAGDEVTEKNKIPYVDDTSSGFPAGLLKKTDYAKLPKSVEVNIDSWDDEDITDPEYASFTDVFVTK